MEKTALRDQSHIDHFTNVLDDFRACKPDPPFWSIWKAAVEAIAAAHADGHVSSELKTTLLSYLYERLGVEVFDQVYFQVSETGRKRLLDAVKRAEQAGCNIDDIPFLEGMDAILPHIQVSKAKATRKKAPAAAPDEAGTQTA